MALIVFLISGVAAWGRGGLTGGGAVAPSTPTVYYLTGFNDSTNGPLRIFQSYDGISWTPNPGCGVYNNAPPFVRDPNVFVDHNQRPLKLNNLYWLAHTDASFTVLTPHFSLASSPDLCTWTFSHTVDCSPITGTVTPFCWSPVFYEEISGLNTALMHTITAMCNNCNDSAFQLYEQHPLTPTDPSAAWSTPVAVGFTNGLSNVIDAHLIFDGSVRRLFLKNENPSSQCIEEWTSSSDLTGYTVLRNGNWAGWGCNRESTSYLKIGSLWYVYMRHINVAPIEMDYSTNTDLSLTSGWSTPKSIGLTPVADATASGVFKVAGAIVTPPTPISINFSPAAPQIADNSLAGVQVATIAVTMSDGSQFSGTLTFAPPTTCTIGTCFGNSSGMFAVATAPNVLTLNRDLVAGDDGTHSATVAATQNGTTVEASVNVTVVPPASACNNPPAPPPAVAAGFTTLAYCSDFSQPSFSNIANWVDGCGGPTTPPRWWFGWWGQFGNPPHQGAPCAAIIMETDAQAGGKQVLHLQYLPAYNAVGSNNLNQILTMAYPIMPFGLDKNNYFPSTFYIEILTRQQTATSLTQAKQVNNSSYWSASQQGVAVLEEDFMEVFSNTGPPLWTYAIDAQLNATDWTAYHNYGTLYTSSGTPVNQDPVQCAFVDGNVISGNCAISQRGGDITGHDRVMIFGFGTDSNNLANGTIINNVDVLIQNIKVWTCAGAFMTSTNCFGTVVDHWPFP